MASRPLRAVLLARVSTHKRSQDASNPRQISDLRDVARRKGWTVTEKFSDRVTGAETGPGLRAGLDLITKGRADVLVVTALDRLGRDVREMLANADRIKDDGGHLFVRETVIDTSSPDGRLQFTLLAALAEFQRRSNRFKIYAGLEHARKKGVRLGRAPSISPPVLARAVELRRRRPPMSWNKIRQTLRREKRGSFPMSTLARLVTRALIPVERGRKSDGKKMERRRRR